MGGDIGEIYKYVNHYAVVTKASTKIILVQVYIIFAFPLYSNEVIERHQNLFYGRLIPLALVVSHIFYQFETPRLFPAGRKE